MAKRNELPSKEDLFRKINGFHSGYAAIKENARLYKQRMQENKPTSVLVSQKTKIEDPLELGTIHTNSAYRKVEFLTAEPKNSRGKNKTPGHDREHQDLEKRNSSPEKKRFDLSLKKISIQEDPLRKIIKKPGSPPVEKVNSRPERTVQTYRDELNTDEKNLILLSNSPSPSKNINPFRNHQIHSIKSNPTSLKGSPRLDGILTTEAKTIQSHRNHDLQFELDGANITKKTPRLEKKSIQKSKGGKQRLATENLAGQNASFSDSNISRGKIKPLSLNMKNSLIEQKGNILADQILMSGSRTQKGQTASKEEIENHFLHYKSFQCKSAMNSLMTFKSNRPDTFYQSASSKTKINTERTSPAFGENKGSFFYHQENICSLKSVTEGSNLGNAFSILRDPTPDRLESLYLRSSSLGDTENLTPILNKRRLESDDLALDYVRRLTFKPTDEELIKIRNEESKTPSKQKTSNVELDSKTRFFAKKIMKNQKPHKRSITPLGISTQNPLDKARPRPCSTSRSCRKSQDSRSRVSDHTIFCQNLKISNPDDNFSFNQLKDSMGESKPDKDAKVPHFPPEIETNHLTRPSKKMSPVKAEIISEHQVNTNHISSLPLEEKESNPNPNLESLFKLAEEKILQKINQDGLSPETATNLFLQEFQNQLTSNPRWNVAEPAFPQEQTTVIRDLPTPKNTKSNEYQNISRSLQFLGELEETDRLEILVAMSKDIDKIQEQEGYDSAIDLIREFLAMIQSDNVKTHDQWQSLEVDFCNKLGAYLYKKGDYDEALKELTKILQIDSANLPALYKIHEIHLKLGNRKEAKLVLKQIRANFQDSQSPLETNNPDESRRDYINTILEVDESFDSSE